MQPKVSSVLSSASRPDRVVAGYRLFVPAGSSLKQCTLDSPLAGKVVASDISTKQAANLPPLIDTHCHLADSRLHQDVDGAIERAAAAGVRVIVTVGAIGTIQTDRETVAIADAHEHVYAVIGVHPHDADSCDEQ